MSRVFPSVLRGKSVFGKTALPVLSPLEQVLHQYLPLEDPLSRVSEISQTAAHGFRQWAARPPAERRDVLLDAAHRLERDSQTFIDYHCSIGAHGHFAEIGVKGAVENIREYASQITRPPGSVVHLAATDLALAVHQPLGPVLAIAAWNSPTILWMRALVAPLAAGCSVVAKAHGSAPGIPVLLAEHLLQAGVDPAALQVVQVAPDLHKPVTEAFLANRHIRKVNFTGLTAVGREVAVAAAAQLKPALLELDGKNPAVVLADADVPAAARNAALSAWLNAGQICMSLDVCYVHSSQVDEFVSCVGGYADMAVQRGPAAAARVNALVDDAVAKGAKVHFKGSGPCPAVVLSHVPEALRLAHAESFGPVVCVEPFDDVDAAVAKINAQPHGLKALVWSRDTVEALRVARALEFGGVHINSSTVHDEATVPHGGVKESGSGRFNAAWGVADFSYTKAITVLA